jgi:hypothetical protein
MSHVQTILLLFFMFTYYYKVYIKVSLTIVNIDSLGKVNLSIAHLYDILHPREDVDIGINKFSFS